TVQRHFEASLGSHQDPRFLAPLAHLVGPDGPSGRIVGLVTAAAPPGQQAPDRAAGEVRRWPLGVPVVSRASDAESGEPVASSPPVGSDAADAEPQVQRAVSDTGTDTRPTTLPSFPLVEGVPAAAVAQQSLVTAPPPERVSRELPTISRSEDSAAPASAS